MAKQTITRRQKEKIAEVQNVWKEKGYEKDEEACDETQKTPKDEKVALRFRKMRG